MKTTDARRLTHKELTDLRKRGVTAVQEGESPETVARVLRVSRSTLYGWLARYRNGGWGNLNAAKRGGRRPKLDAKALEWLYDAITMGNPQQYKFDFALWTSQMIAQSSHSLSMIGKNGRFF